MLKDYSLLDVDQVLLLIKTDRKRALAHDDHNKSKHLFHFQKALNTFKKLNKGNVIDYTTYHDVSKFLTSPYIYDTADDRRVLIHNFNTPKSDANNTALKIIKADKKFGGYLGNYKLDDKVLKDAKKPAYTPKIASNKVHKSLMADNRDAKLLFKKYYHNDFKKANNGAGDDIYKSTFSTVGRTVKSLNQQIKAGHKNIKSLKEIINDIRHVAKENPKLHNHITDFNYNNTPLDLYKSYLHDAHWHLQDAQHSLKEYKSLNDDVLLCNNHVATPIDIEKDVHVFQPSMSFKTLAVLDLNKIKNK